MGEYTHTAHLKIFLCWSYPKIFKFFLNFNFFKVVYEHINGVYKHGRAFVTAYSENLDNLELFRYLLHCFVGARIYPQTPPTPTPGFRAKVPKLPTNANFAIFHLILGVFNASPRLQTFHAKRI